MVVYKQENTFYTKNTFIMNIHVIAPFIFWTTILKKTTLHSQIKWQTNFKDDKINHWQHF